MRVDIVSDIHVEFNHSGFYKPLLKDSLSKKIIVAGDMGPVNMPETQLAFVRMANKYEEVIYVPGNHDYYSSSIDEGDQILDELEDRLPNLTILRPGRATHIGEYLVIGATLWVPDSFALHQRENMINDPLRIRNLYNRIAEINKEHSEFLYNNTNNKTIVVTHHLPTPECIAPEYKNQGTNCWFLSDETKTVVDKEPYMWIYGHSHVRMDFTQHKTRFINNAYGYPKENKPLNVVTYEIG